MVASQFSGKGHYLDSKITYRVLTYRVDELLKIHINHFSLGTKSKIHFIEDLSTFSVLLKLINLSKLM